MKLTAKHRSRPGPALPIVLARPVSADRSDPMTETEEQLAQAIADLEATRRRLDTLILRLCPGPHKTVQHRDRKPPWCEACGRTAAGTPVR